MKPSEVAKALTICIASKQPALVWGAPGVGKSQVAQQTAAALNRVVHDVRASLLDPVDLRGIPHIVNGKTAWAAPAFLPSSTVPAIILLDELNRAPVLTQNGLFQLVLDRKLGEYVMPDECEVIGCCNRESDGGGVQRMPQALANRFVHLTMEPDLEDWSKWAVNANIEPAVIAFLRFRPELLHKFSQSEKAFPTPRSWEFVSRITAQKPGNGIELYLYAGSVGEGAAIEYSAFLRLFRSIPSIDTILLNPQTAPVPSGPATLFAVAAALARRATASSFARIIQYFDRLPQEYAVYGVQDSVRRDSSLQSTPDFTKWAIAHSETVF
jgi:MoxR-like ATPase